MSVRVPFGDRLGGWLQEHARPVMLWLGDVETRVLGEALQAQTVRAPVWITGMARAGSTKLLELLSSLPGHTSHRYADFAGLYTPWWWNWLRARTRFGARAALPVERAHADRIQITAESPEAFEEPLWRAHLPDWRTLAFDPAAPLPQWARRHRAHLAKLLLVRGAQRYVGKANEHLPRLRWLLAQYPDARFIVPVRDPVSHVGSLLKQDRLLSALGQTHAAVRRHLRRAGHTEFGLDRTVPALHHPAAALARAAFAEGDPVRGYAQWWNALYGGLQTDLAQHPRLAQAVCIVRYEDLCGTPEQTLGRVLHHLDIAPEIAAATITRHAHELSLPDYYRSPLDQTQQAQVRALCAPVARVWGYCGD